MVRLAGGGPRARIGQVRAHGWGGMAARLHARVHARTFACFACFAFAARACAGACARACVSLSCRVRCRAGSPLLPSRRTVRRAAPSPLAQEDLRQDCLTFDSSAAAADAEAVADIAFGGFEKAPAVQTERKWQRRRVAM